jgi:hypothetical protein
VSEGIDGNPDLWELERRGKVRLGSDGKSPVPDDRRETINRAPVDGLAHEFVIKKPD